MINVTIWNEFHHEKTHEEVAALFPKGIHMHLAEVLGTCEGLNIRTATLEEPEHGLTDEVLNSTDVLVWWGHMAHNKVCDEIAKKVQQRVLSGMGFIALHSAHFSKPFKALMGTNCSLRWRDNDFCRVWNVMPNHPIAQGVGDYIDLECEEMYGEFFDVPTPDELVFVSWFEGGEIFRGGCVWNRGMGKVFFFHPGHETNKSFFNPQVQQVIKNAVKYVAPVGFRDTTDCEKRGESLESIRKGGK